ncbi:MAG: peptide ABC transporter substrate-binding protein [Actinomycetota bacterium]
MAIGQPATLDPVLASQPAERVIVSAIFDALVGYQATTANVVPGVALSWTITGHNTVFTFHLQSGTRFSDGEPVTAQSFVRGMTRALSPSLSNAPGSLSGELDEIVGAAAVTDGTATTLAGAVAVNATTLQIRLSAPDAEFLLRCGDGPFMPIPKTSAMEARNPSWAADPLGNGPFELATPPPGGWLSASQVVLVPNPDYAGAPPKVAQAVLKVIPDVSAAEKAWMDGQVDWAPIPPTATAQVEALGKKSFLDDPLGLVDYLAVETGSLAAGSDPEALREAISLAINRGVIAGQLYDGAASVARGFVPPVVPGSASAPGAGPGPCPDCDFQPQQARQLLAQSGISVTGAVQLVFPAGAGEDAVMAAVAQDLQQNLGIDAVPTPVPAIGVGAGAGETGAVGASGLRIVGVSQVMDYPGADDFLSSLISTSSGAVLSADAQSALGDALAAARAVASPAQRATAYANAERLVMQDLPVIPLVWPKGVVLARLSHWSFLTMNPFGEPSLRTVTPKG